MNVPRARGALMELRRSIEQLFDMSPPPASESERVVARWFGDMLDLVGVAEGSLEPTDKEGVAGEQDASQACG